MTPAEKSAAKLQGKPARLLLAAALAALVGGCTLAPRYHTPLAPVPAQFPGGDAYPEQQQAALPAYSWRDVFPDPRLKALIEQALANNEDVRGAIANIEIARAQYQIQRAELLPELDATASYRRSKGQTNSGGVAVGGNNSIRDNFTAEGSVASWEIDFFGRLRSLSSAARNRYLGSEAAARATRLTLVADVADAWLNYALDQSLLKIARDTADSAAESVRLTKSRFEGGIAPRSDLRQAEIILETANADAANQTTLVAQDRNALQLLVGGPIDDARLPPSIEDAMAGLVEVPAGLDSSILLRRPDVAQAEYALRAANAQIGAARAALFPKISLTGLLGFASSSLGALFDHGSFLWQAGGNASQTIFAGGAVVAGIRQSNAERDAALAAYRKAVESAFVDVANTLARRGTIERQLQANERGREAAADNLHLADLRYRGGVISFLDDLTARQALYSAERSLASSRALRATNLVALYRSLGGDPLTDAPAMTPVPAPGSAAAAAATPAPATP